MPSTAVVHSAPPPAYQQAKVRGKALPGHSPSYPSSCFAVMNAFVRIASHLASHCMLLESSFVHFVRVLARRQQLPESHRQLPDSNAVYAYQNRKSPGADIAHANFSSRALGKKARLSMGESVRLHLHVATPCSARRTRNKQHHASNRRISAGTIYSYRALCTQQCELR